MTKEINAELDDLEAVRLIVNTLSPFKADDQMRIMRWVQEKLGLNFGILTIDPTERSQTTTATDRPTTNTNTAAANIRTFIQEKTPGSDNQFAACVAYFYKFEAVSAERKDSINSVDLQEATRKAGRNRLGDPVKTLSNAAAQGWLDKKDRGTYEINTVGENLVAMALPANQASAAASVRTTKMIRKSPGKRK